MDFVILMCGSRRYDAVAEKKKQIKIKNEVIGGTPKRTNRAELCMILRNTFHCMQLHANLLPRPQLREDDIWVRRCWMLRDKGF